LARVNGIWERVMEMDKYLMREFLNLPHDGQSCIRVTPQNLNPLLKCLEVMGESCIIEMKLPDEPIKPLSKGICINSSNEITYYVYRRKPQTQSSDAYKHIPGVGMIENPAWNQCGVLKCDKEI
jgi:hypothetical protein